MGFKKTVLVIFSLGILGLGVWGLLQAAKHPKLNQIRAALGDRAKLIYANLQTRLSPARPHPLSTIELEESLKANLPSPFTKFTQDDWDWFWHLLYGRFEDESEGWPRRVRQLSREEIQNILADNYHRPFASFGDKQWSIFWQQILKGRVFKR